MMVTMMIKLRVMIVSTEMIEKYDHADDDDEGGVTWHCVALAECRMQKGRNKTRIETEFYPNNL